jgi:hypothetical protein
MRAKGQDVNFMTQGHEQSISETRTKIAGGAGTLMTARVSLLVTGV